MGLSGLDAENYNLNGGYQMNKGGNNDTYEVIVLGQAALFPLLGGG